MNWFKKKIKKKISLIKTVQLSKNDWETSYHTEIDGAYVSNSSSSRFEEANDFFVTVLRNNGVTKLREIVEEEYR